MSPIQIDMWEIYLMFQTHPFLVKGSLCMFYWVNPALARVCIYIIIYKDNYKEYPNVVFSKTNEQNTVILEL